MSALDDLCFRLDGEGDPAVRVDVLLAGLAERMAATSNDQNVQRLARALRAAAPQLKAALLAPAAGTTA